MRPVVRTPTFLVIGAQKAGTTALYGYLRRRADVFMSPVKEPVIFARDFDVQRFTPEVRRHVAGAMDIEEYFRNPGRPMPFCLVHDWEQYLRLFSGVRDQVAVGEACTWNLPSRAAPAEIRRRLPDVRIVMVLRNPIDRAYSAYRMFWGQGMIRGTFRRTLEREVNGNAQFGRSFGLVQFGQYADAVRRYVELYPAERIRIYRYEDLKIDPQGVVRDVLSFVGASTDGPLNVTGEFNRPAVPRFPVLHGVISRLPLGASAVRQIWKSRSRSPARWYWTSRPPPPMLAGDRAFLRSVFASDVESLSDLLQKDFSAWLS